MAKKKKYNSFTFYSQHSMMRVVLLTMFAGVAGAALGLLFLFYTGLLG